MLNPSSGPTDFDGVICFGGEDWWYHNRGHYDIQLMRQMSARMPVLYVNSIGMRTPSPGEGRMFVSRVRRKLRSMRRGLVRVDDGLCVYSPFLVPSKLGIAIGGRFVARAIRAAAARQGISRPLVWVACPTAAALIEAIDPAAVVYQRTDRYECFGGVDTQRIQDLDGWLKARADLTVFCSTALYDQEAADCRRATYADHGVDYDRFAQATSAAVEPPDIAGLPRPRVGFVGGIDAHTFDAELFLHVARQIPDSHFVVVGACSLPDMWCDLANVSLLGQRPYESVPAYMAACDVLIMPWNRSPWIEACNPVKLKEYLAVGRPIVSTRFTELRHYAGLVRVAADAGEFAAAIRDALAHPGDPSPRRERVRSESWSSRVDGILRVLGGAPVHRPVVRVAAPAAATTVPVTSPPVRRPIDLAACILLAGGLRPSPLVKAIGRSVLDLSLTPERTVMHCWIDRVMEMADGVPLRVVHDAILPAPWPCTNSDGRVLIEKEPKSLRGPAGVIGDLCRQYEPHQCVIVAEAARYVSCSLRALIAAHECHDADITVAANADGTPAGIYAIRVGSLDLVPSVGFMDLKEQWLRRAVDAGLNVRVHEVAPPGSLPLRTRKQFLRAAAVANTLPAFDGPPVICRGSRVEPGATIESSVIMPGAVVASNAIVVRSLVAPNGHIESGADIVDAVVHAG